MTSKAQKIKYAQKALSKLTQFDEVVVRGDFIYLSFGHDIFNGDSPRVIAEISNIDTKVYIREQEGHNSDCCYVCGIGHDHIYELSRGGEDLLSGCINALGFLIQVRGETVLDRHRLRKKVLMEREIISRALEHRSGIKAVTLQPREGRTKSIPYLSTSTFHNSISLVWYESIKDHGWVKNAEEICKMSELGVDLELTEEERGARRNRVVGKILIRLLNG